MWVSYLFYPASLTLYFRFLGHFSVCSVGQQSIPVKYVQACTGGVYDEGGFSDHDEVHLIPGQHTCFISHIK